MEAEPVDVPRLVGLRHCAVVVLFTLVGDGNVVPGPVAVTPIKEILKQLTIITPFIVKKMFSVRGSGSFGTSGRTFDHRLIRHLLEDCEVNIANL